MAAGAGRPLRLIGVVALAVFSIFCAPAASVRLKSDRAEVARKTAEAEAQVKRGCYIGFKRAIGIYREIYANPRARKTIAPAYIKALLLTAVRERELGILGHNSIRTGLEILRDQPSLARYRPYFEVADCLPLRTRGVMQDQDIVDVKKRVYDDILTQGLVRDDLKARALEDDSYAYLYVAFFTGYGFFAEKKDELAGDLITRFPQSIFMRYRGAIAPQPDADRLRSLLDEEPEFHEAHYYLGELAIGRQNLIEAEKEFSAAAAGLPESPQVPLYLAGICTALEEFDKSLEFYDRTIALAPGYRDALLGKALSLSYLGRFEDAILVLKRIVELGFYMLGEAHYWLSWNYHALKDLDSAQAYIEESKGRLPTNSEVFGLAGTIAAEKGQDARAETEFLEALEYNIGNTEALYGLAGICARRQKWLESGGYCERAGLAFERNSAAILAKMDEIRSSSLSADRKATLLARKTHKLDATQAARASSFYNAAASYLNAGNSEKALGLAKRAAEHPSLKEKAEDLIRKIAEDRGQTYTFDNTGRRRDPFIPRELRGGDLVRFLAGIGTLTPIASNDSTCQMCRFDPGLG